MGRHDWYRLSTWDQKSQHDFEQRLSRARKSNRSQYLICQASCLHAAGLYEEALGLIDRAISDCPDPIDLSSAYLIRAQCSVGLKDFEGATANFRAALQAERNFPNVQTTACLEFAMYAIEHNQRELYTEALAILGEFRNEDPEFPKLEYMYFAAKAVLTHELKLEDAATYAHQANLAAEQTYSGYRKHPDLGLVESEPVWLRERLDAIHHR